MPCHKIPLMPPSKVAIIGNCAPGIKVNYAGIIFEGLGYFFNFNFLIYYRLCVIEFEKI